MNEVQVRDEWPSSERTTKQHARLNGEQGMGRKFDSNNFQLPFIRTIRQMATQLHIQCLVKTSGNGEGGRDHSYFIIPMILNNDECFSWLIHNSIYMVYIYAVCFWLIAG